MIFLLPLLPFLAFVAVPAFPFIMLYILYRLTRFIFVHMPSFDDDDGISHNVYYVKLIMHPGSLLGLVVLFVRVLSGLPHAAHCGRLGL